MKSTESSPLRVLRRVFGPRVRPAIPEIADVVHPRLAAICFTHKQLSGGAGHEHLERLWWASADGKVGSMDIATVVDWLAQGNRAYVRKGSDRVEVFVVHETMALHAHVRTAADELWTDDLLALPDRDL